MDSLGEGDVMLVRGHMKPEGALAHISIRNGETALVPIRKTSPPARSATHSLGCACPSAQPLCLRSAEQMSSW